MHKNYKVGGCVLDNLQNMKTQGDEFLIIIFWRTIWNVVSILASGMNLAVQVSTYLAISFLVTKTIKQKHLVRDLTSK